MRIPAGLAILSHGEDILPAVDWSVYKRFDRVVNYIHKDRLLSVCAASIPSGVDHLVLNVDDLEWLQSVQTLTDRVVLNGVAFPLDPCKLYRVPPLPLPASFDHILTLESWLRAQAPPLSIPRLLHEASRPGSFDAALGRVFEEGIDLLESREFLQATRLLKGCGFGSTPSGNDFMSGYLMALAWLTQAEWQTTGLPESGPSVGKRGRLPLHRGSQKNRLSEIADLILYEILGTDPLCDAFARRARALKPDSDWKELLQVFADQSADARPALEAVLSHGSTSGADALAGFFMGLRSYHMEVK